MLGFPIGKQRLLPGIGVGFPLSRRLVPFMEINLTVVAQMGVSQNLVWYYFLIRRTIVCWDLYSDPLYVGKLPDSMLSFTLVGSMA